MGTGSEHERWPLRWWEEVLAIWLVTAGSLHLLRHLLASVLDLPSNLDPANGYLWIAEHGYPRGTQQLGWFPGYPMAIRLVSSLGYDYETASRLVTVAAGIAIVLLLATWLRDHGASRAVVRCTVLALVLWPNAFLVVGGVTYSEGLFLALALGACVVDERGRRALAAVLLVGACATRLAGVAFVVGLAIRNAELSGAITGTWRRRRALPSLKVDRRALHARDATPLFGLLGTAAFLGYCWIVHGDVLAYFRIQDSLTPSGPRWHPLVWTHEALLVRTPDWVSEPGHAAYSWMAAALVVAAIATVPAIVRRYGPGYGACVAILLGLIWFGPWDFSSAFRYLMAAFPLFAVWGERLARSGRVAWAVLATSAAGLLWFSLVHYAGMYLATW